MCLIAFAFKVHPQYPLILIANRDEFYQRPTRSAQFWEEEGYPEILAGKDLTANGTWLGVNRSGKWAALTNYRDLNHLKKNPPSRGALTLDYLKTDISAHEYLNKIKENAQEYNDFNLLVGNREELLYYSNVSDSIIKIRPGIHGVSNALLNFPWRKLEIAKTELKTHLDQNNLDPKALFHILSDQTQEEEAYLPETGLPKEREKTISSIFITSKDYGTKCSTLLFLNNEGQIRFLERSFTPSTNQISKEEKFVF